MTTVGSNSRRESINCEFCILNCELFPSPPHSFERLLFCACCGLPHPGFGRFGECRRERSLLVLFASCQRFCSGGQRLGTARSRKPASGRLSAVRFSRALRPSIYGSCFSFFRTLRRMRCNPLRVSGVAAKRRVNSSSSSASHSAGVMATGSKSGSKSRLACRGAFRL